MAARKELCLEDKVKVIRENEKFGKSQRDLAKTFGVGKTQILNILKRKRELVDAFEGNEAASRKRRLVTTENDEINTLTWQWFSRIRALNMPVSGPMIQEKALSYAKQLGRDTFKASNGWLNSFKKRHNIGQQVVSGESAYVDPVTVDSWKERLPTITEGYAARDIWNMDETGLFFRALPDRSLTIKGEDCKGGKRAKDRLTVVMCYNMEGENYAPLVIGKAAQPRCFKHISAQALPVKWRSNRRAWMTSELFKEWLKAFNTKMRTQNRHALMMLDNAPSHPHGLDLSHVKCAFFPPNTTSILQPMDQGVIKTFKTIYRKKLLQHVLALMDSQDAPAPGDIHKHITVLDACYWTRSAIRDIKPETVVKCFARCGFTTAPAADTDTDAPRPQDALQELLALAKSSLHLVEPFDLADYLALDDFAPATEELAPDWEQQLLDDLHPERQEVEEEAAEEEEDEEEPSTACEVTSVSQALHLAKQLQLFATMQADSKLADSLSESVELLNQRVVNHRISMKQATLHSFFGKK